MPERYPVTPLTALPVIAGNRGTDGACRFGAPFRLAALLVFCLLVSGCAGGRLRDARQAFFLDGDPDAAVQLLEKKGPAGLSALLVHMEKGMLLHHAGRYRESIAQLRKASDLIDKLDYISVSQQTASLVVNDWMTAYKGEYCERLWVHTYLMIDYLMVRAYEDALVEAKQALAVIDAYPEALSEAYFSLALIGLCYELLGEYNDAYIVYERLSKRMPDPEPLREQRRRMAWLAGIAVADDPSSVVPELEREKRSRQAAGGELILFVTAGYGPVKVSSDIFLPPGIRISFPRYENRSGTTGHADVYAGDLPLAAKGVSTDLNRVARISLSERAKTIVAKEAARVLAKEAIAQQLEEEHDAFVGFVTRLILMATENADTRSWQTLPASHTLLRLPLAPGPHRLAVKFEEDAVDHRINLPPVTIRKGQRLFFAISATDRFAVVHGREPVPRPVTNGMHTQETIPPLPLMEEGDAAGNPAP